MNAAIKRGWSILFQTVPGASRSVFLFFSISLLASPTLHAFVDLNNNGVSDPWERNHNFGNLYTSFDPNADPDGDGWTNEQEAVTGTHPGEANPPTGFLRPEITHYPAVYLSPEEEGDPPILISPPTTSIEWPTLTGKKYTLSASTDLTPGSWIQVGQPRIGSTSILGTNIPLTQPDGSIPEKLFLRVAAEDTDSDGDGLTNHEEHQLGSNPHDPDSDDDGVSDGQEQSDGSDLNDPQSAADHTGSNDPYRPRWSVRLKMTNGYVSDHYDPVAGQYSGQDVFVNWQIQGGYSAGNFPAAYESFQRDAGHPVSVSWAEDLARQKLNLSLAKYSELYDSPPGLASSYYGLFEGDHSIDVGSFWSWQCDIVLYIPKPRAQVVSVNVIKVTRHWDRNTNTPSWQTDLCEPMVVQISAGSTKSAAIELRAPMVADKYLQVLLLPVDLISDLNNDGQITAADNPLRDAATASGATDEIKDKGTEFIFHNDTLSNGIWDKEDTTTPGKPADADDDDAQPILVNISSLPDQTQVWLEHPASAGLKYYRDRKCTQEIPLLSSQRHVVGGSVAWPTDNKLFMRANVDGALTYPPANPQFEGDLVLKIKVGTNGQEIEAVKMKLTVVKQLGAKKFFHAARDYILEENTKLLVHDWAFPIISPTTTIRMCIMREEATHMQPWESYHDDAYDNYVTSGSTTPFDPRTFTSCGLGIDGAANQDPEMTVIINGNQCDFTDSTLPDPRTEAGRIARLVKLTALTVSGETLLTDRCHGRVIISQVGPYGIRNATSSDLDDPNALAPATTFRGSYLAGDDPVLGTTIPGGKYISQIWDGRFEIGADRVPDTVYPGPQNAMGGLSGSYGSSDRDNYPNSFVGYAPMTATGTTGKGVVFVAAGKGDDGMGKVKEFYEAAKASDVPLIPGATPSDGLPIIQLVLLDSGKTSTALVHKNPAGSFQTVYKGSKHNGFPYYTNTFLRFKATKPRP